MKTEINLLIRRLENTSNGEPWFGRAVYTILDEVPSQIVYKKPNGSEHSLIELLYHMITWASFTLDRLEKKPIRDTTETGDLDWRNIDPKIHTWQKGLSEFRSINQKIIAVLKKKDDSFLEEKVEYRGYDYQFLVNGMIDHTIYHLGQVAYVKKMLG